MPAARAEVQYPWCAYYSGGDGDGGTNCGFTTLAQCRAAGCTFDEIEVRKADLEDVFVQVMNGAEVIEGLA